MADPTTKAPPLIGHFDGQARGPQQNSPRVPRKEPPSGEPNDPADKAVQETMDIVDKQILEPMIKEGTPEGVAETYEEGLKKVGLTLADARAIMEQVLVNNFYEETYYIQSLPVTFRTRSYHDTVRLHKFLTAESPVYQASIQDLIARHNLAAALKKYGDREFAFPDDASKAEDAFDERMTFVESRVEHVTTRLMKLAYKFDEKLTKVFADGAPQDF